MKTLRTKEEQIVYFKNLAHVFEVQAHREDDRIAQAVAHGKAEAYKLCAFEIENNME